MFEAGETRLLYEMRGRICFLTLNRAEVLNALDAKLRDQLGKAIEAFDNDSSLSVAVLQGAGGRAFSVGADLKELRAGAEETAYGTNVAFPIPSSDHRGGIAAVGACRKPVIAAVDGYCLAAGFEVALQCDIRVATRQSTFSLPEPRRGLLGDTGLHELCRVVPLGEALLVQLTGSAITAERAHQIGLVQNVTNDRDELDRVVLRIASDICKCSPSAVRAIKNIVRTGRELPLKKAWEYAEPWQRAAAQGSDAVEGVRAFVERRLPAWDTTEPDR